MTPRPATLPRAAFAGAFALMLLLAACQSAANDPSASIQASPSVAPASTAADPTTSPTASPSDDLGAFTCAMPVEGDGSVPHSQITDVRVGSHDGYDRIVIDFDDGIPPYVLQAATPPLLSDPAGMEMDVGGTAFLNLVLMGGTRVTEDGELTYDGRTDFRPDGFPALAQLVESGDFEATSAWYIGLNQEPCVRVLALTDPARLVIDLQP